MKRTKTIALIVLVMLMSFTIGVSAGGKWRGSQRTIITEQGGR